MNPVRFKKNEKAAKAVADFYKNTPRLYMHSFGCQQNVNDGEKIKGVLADIGFEACESAENADIVIFNTCAVREHAEQRVFGHVGALKKFKEKNPKMIIGVCGCMAQQSEIVEKLKQSYPYVDLVFGVNGIDLLPDMIIEKLETQKRIFKELGDRPDVVEDMPIKRDSSFRAWLPVMYGCDNFCSYCIVPYVRGRERSRKSEDIIAEFKQLIKDGYKDITLLGQNVNSYGKGLEEEIDFADLLKKLDEIDGDFRIRFMTSHPKDATKKLIDTIVESKHICRHLHLPVQSGSDDILAKMNRHYDTAAYMQLVDYAKEKCPEMTFSSDIIVGFPGETQEDFEKTVELLKKVKYMQLFTFIYSKRPGTRAAEMPDATPYKAKSDRIGEILKLQEGIVEELCKTMLDKIVKVLVEGTGREPASMTGRLDNNMTVEFAGDESMVGKFADIKITGQRGAILLGELA